jgi:hypothetical protein
MPKREGEMGDVEAQATPVDRRHPLLTLFLWWLVTANIIGAVGSPVWLVSIRRPAIPDFPEWAGWAVGVLSALAAGCAFAVLRWERWGFYGYALTAAAVYAVNVFAGVGAGGAAVGFTGTAALFLLLHVGSESKAWPRLR